MKVVHDYTQTCLRWLKAQTVPESGLRRALVPGAIGICTIGTLIFLSIVSFSAREARRAPIDGVSPAAYAATQEARSHLDDFLRRTVSDGPSDERTRVKVAFPISNFGTKQVEELWVGPIRWVDEETLAGRLDSEPNQLKDHHLGDDITFRPEMIRDWMFYGEQGELFGNFSTRVILDEMHQTTAREIESLLSPTATPKRWEIPDRIWF